MSPGLIDKCRLPIAFEHLRTAYASDTSLCIVKWYQDALKHLVNIHSVASFLERCVHHDPVAIVVNVEVPLVKPCVLHMGSLVFNGVDAA